MGILAAYSLVAGTYLLAAYLIYKWLLSGENQPTFNRYILLLLYVIALILPCTPELTIPSKVSTFVAGGLEIGAPEIAVIEDKVFHWQSIAILIYTIGVIITAVASLISLIRLTSIIRKGRKIFCDNYTIVILPSTNLAPFSWMHYIVMSETDYKDAGDMIINHECSHLNLLHWIDLLLAQIVIILLWYNPAAWLMRSELRSVHEYQADSAVLRCGTDARQYQLLLIKKAVGQRFPSLANSLNHSKLKKRITMMCNPETGKTRRLRALAVVPAIAVAFAFVNIPSIASAVTKVADEIQIVGYGGGDNTTVAKDSIIEPEVLPSFVGGEQKLYNYLAMEIIYPSEASKKGIQGRVVVSFIVEADGRISNCRVVEGVDPYLDAEAIRVVGNMPKWTPGKNGGKDVRCSYTIPVSFKLQK